MHCNNGLNNKLVESLVENKVAQETGDLKYLQDSMYNFISTLKEIILGEYSPEFFNKYVDEALKLYGSSLDELLKIPKMGLELRQALNSIDEAIDASKQEFRDNLVLLLDRFQTTLDNMENQWLDSLTSQQKQEIAKLEARIVNNEKITKDSKYAASRLVGANKGQVPLAEDVFKAAYGLSFPIIENGDDNIDNLPIGTRNLVAHDVKNSPSGLISNYWITDTIQGHSAAGLATVQIAHGHAYDHNLNVAKRVRGKNGWSGWTYFYGTHNTTKDTATGFLKASSPVLHVYNDSITKIHEAEQLDIKVDKKGIGHYEIHGTTGLRKNDGWFMSPPRDVHGNVLCMIDVTEKDDVVILKTYKKKFDFETVSIVHDYDNPMDIPEGVCVEFRFNDLPREQLEVPNPEVEDK